MGKPAPKPTEQEAAAIAASTDTELLVEMLKHAADSVPDFKGVYCGAVGPRMEKIAHLARCMIAGIGAGFECAAGTAAEVTVAPESPKAP